MKDTDTGRLVVADDGSIVVMDHVRGRACGHCYSLVGSAHEAGCYYQEASEWAQLVPPRDFRPITRREDLMLCTVNVVMPSRHRGEYLFLQCGEVHLRPRHDSQQDWVLSAYLGRSATDFEHDSGYAFKLALFAVMFEYVDYHTMFATGFIPLDEPDKFRVPAPDYDPFASAATCVQCETHHPMVQEGNYVPDGDVEAYKHLRGKRVRISIGPAHEETDS